MTVETLLKSELWQAFEITLRDEQQQPGDVLAELIGDYIEAKADARLDEQIEEFANPHGYTEDDAVELVKRARRERSQV